MYTRVICKFVAELGLDTKCLIGFPVMNKKFYF